MQRQQRAPRVEAVRVAHLGVGGRVDLVVLAAAPALAPLAGEQRPRALGQLGRLGGVARAPQALPGRGTRAAARSARASTRRRAWPGRRRPWPAAGAGPRSAPGRAGAGARAPPPARASRCPPPADRSSSAPATRPTRPTSGAPRTPRARDPTAARARAPRARPRAPPAPPPRPARPSSVAIRLSICPSSTTSELRPTSSRSSVCARSSKAASSNSGRLSIAASSIAPCLVCTNVPSPVGEEPCSSTPLPSPSRWVNHQSWARRSVG